MSSLTIGLTGGIGAGKTFVTDCFSSLGVAVIDADVISRQVTAPKQPSVYKIAEHFNASNLVDSSGVLNRGLLKNLVFNDPQAKKWLEDELHPIIFSAISEELSQVTTAYKILSSPLLFETQQDKLVDQTLVVDTPVSLQLERTCTRDDSNSDLVQKIIDSQISREKRLALADYVIDNSGSKYDTIEQIKTLHAQFLTLAPNFSKQGVQHSNDH